MGVRDSASMAICSSTVRIRVRLILMPSLRNKSCKLAFRNTGGSMPCIEPAHQHQIR